MKTVLFALTIFFSTAAYSQSELLNEDFSELWLPGQIRLLDDSQKVTKPEPIGYFGSNYYRFRIHFISIIQNPSNKKQYLVYGKNKLKENVSDFQGFIEIDSVSLYDSPNKTGVKEGAIIARYAFYENHLNSGTGKFEGVCQTFIQQTSDNGAVEYNTVAFFADGFTNNLFEGHWVNYKTGAVKTCNWGDYRIPNSKDLDTGAGEFYVNSKYLGNGWKSYEDANHPFPYTDEQKEAKKKALIVESEEWWK